MCRYRPYSDFGYNRTKISGTLHEDLFVCVYNGKGTGRGKAAS